MDWTFTTPVHHVPEFHSSTLSFTLDVDSLLNFSNFSRRVVISWWVLKLLNVFSLGLSDVPLLSPSILWSWMDIPPFDYLFISGGPLGCFHLSALMNNAAMNTDVERAIQGPAFDPLGICPDVKLLDPMVIQCVRFWGTAVLIPQQTRHFTISRAKHRNSTFSASSPTLVNSCSWFPFCFFIVGIGGVWRGFSLCACNPHFDEFRSWATFPVLSGHWDTFWEISIQIIANM